MNESTAASRERRIATAAAALARHADPGPTALSSLTDEQLLVLHGTPDPDHLLTPWIDRMASTPEQRDLVIASAVRGQLAGGAVAPEGTLAAVEEREPVGAPDDLLPAALPAGIVGRRVYSRLRVTLTDLDDPERGAMQVFADQDGTVMLEQISSHGIHHFTMSTIASAARVQSVWMLGLPEAEDAFTAVDAEPVRSGTWEELVRDPGLSTVLASASRRIRIVAEERAEGTESVLWIVRDETSLIALQPARPSTGTPSLEQGELDAVRISADGLRSQLEDFLTAG